jgi:hypothetical protein
MKIRAITCFLDPSYPFDQQRLKVAGEFLNCAQPAFIAAGYEVQSARLATVPFSSLLVNGEHGNLARLAQDLESAAAELGYAYVSLGPALPEQLESYGSIPDALAATQNAFFSGLLTIPDGSKGGVSLPSGSAQKSSNGQAVSLQMVLPTCVSLLLLMFPRVHLSSQLHTTRALNQPLPWQQRQLTWL